MKTIRSWITFEQRRVPSLFLTAVSMVSLLPAAADAQGLPVDTGSHLPVALWAAGAALLGIVLIYGIVRNRQRTNSDKEITEQATKDLYAKEAQKERHSQADAREL